MRLTFRRREASPLVHPAYGAAIAQEAQVRQAESESVWQRLLDQQRADIRQRELREDRRVLRRAERAS